LLIFLEKGEHAFYTWPALTYLSRQGTRGSWFARI
jgi:hypothetical protein